MVYWTPAWTQVTSASSTSSTRALPWQEPNQTLCCLSSLLESRVVVHLIRLGGKHLNPQIRGRVAIFLESYFDPPGPGLTIWTRRLWRTNKMPKIGAAYSSSPCHHKILFQYLFGGGV